MRTQPALPTAGAPPLIHDGEAALVAAAKDGDREAFSELVRRYEQRIFRLAQNITRNPEDAEDVMQDAFLKAYEHLDSFNGDSRFYTWLVRITVNQALMKLRKRRPNHFSLDQPVAGDGELIPREIEDWGPSPERRYAQSELRGILGAAINQLEPAYRIVFWLRDVEELSTEETARLLGLSIPGVKARLSRARFRLRNILNQFFTPGSDLRLATTS
ncbi:MAG: sigma-70 family RNA polymerase sigma factor [Candidatus Acidiferrales bacterium]